MTKENISKIDRDIIKKYNISNDDILKIYLCWKDEFRVSLNKLKQEIKEELLNKMEKVYLACHDEYGNFDKNKFEDILINKKEF